GSALGVVQTGQEAFQRDKAVKRTIVFGAHWRAWAPGDWLLLPHADRKSQPCRDGHGAHSCRPAARAETCRRRKTAGAGRLPFPADRTPQRSWSRRGGDSLSAAAYLHAAA